MWERAEAEAEAGAGAYAIVYGKKMVAGNSRSCTREVSTCRPFLGGFKKMRCAKASTLTTGVAKAPSDLT